MAAYALVVARFYGELAARLRQLRDDSQST